MSKYHIVGNHIHWLQCQLDHPYRTHTAYKSVQSRQQTLLILFPPITTCSLICLCTWVAYITNSMDPDQTAGSILIWVHSVCYHDCCFDSLCPSQQFFSHVGRVSLGWTSTKQRVKCIAQGHNTVSLVMLQPTNPRSHVKHSTSESPCSCFHDKI